MYCKRKYIKNTNSLKNVSLSLSPLLPVQEADRLLTITLADIPFDRTHV